MFGHECASLGQRGSGDVGIVGSGEEAIGSHDASVDASLQQQFGDARAEHLVEQ
ncbi:MAG: hypothetical protein M3513_10540 [Actinomycetota bacterium]|nr:hypothetical protein [Actinomycetota bacterium]